MTPQKLLVRMAAAVVAAAALPRPEPEEEEESFVGLWTTADGRIRQELRSDGRYVETRGGQQRARSGRYAIIRRHIAYQDDGGGTADGDFLSEDVLRHDGMVLYRRW